MWCTKTLYWLLVTHLESIFHRYEVVNEEEDKEGEGGESSQESEVCGSLSAMNKPAVIESWLNYGGQ